MAEGTAAQVALSEPWGSEDLPSSDEVREVIRAVEDDELVIEQLGLLDSFQLSVPATSELTPMLDALLAPDAPGSGWMHAGERWLGASEMDEGYARLQGRGIDQALDEDVTIHVDSARLRAVVDELVERNPNLPPEALGYRDAWPTTDFRCQISLRLWRAGIVHRSRVRLTVALWTSPPATGPEADGERDGGTDLSSALARLVEFQELYPELILLSLFFDEAQSDVRNVFGVPWLPLRSVVVIPRLAGVPTPADYISGELSGLTQSVARVLFEKADIRAESVSASRLQGTTMCLHRQFSSHASKRVYSSYFYVPLTDDVKQFETDSLDLIGAFETIEGEVAEELWDVSSDLEMIEVQFAVQHRLATEASEVIDALVAHLLDGDLPCPAPWWQLRRCRAYRTSRAGLRDAVELTRRTLVQTEGERAEALAIVREAQTKTADVRAFVRTQADQILTRVAVDGFPTVTDSLLSSEKFVQAERHVAERSAESADDARLARLLETTTNVFVEERERTLEVVERQASVLNLALGVVALFTIIEFLVDVRFDNLDGTWVRVARSVAGAAGLAVLAVLAALWMRTRSERRASVRPTIPDLHGQAVSTMRLLRGHTSAARLELDRSRDLAVSAEIAGLFDDLRRTDAVCEELRSVYIERLAGGALDPAAAEALESAVSRSFAEFVTGRLDGPAWAAVADLDLLRVEASAWSLRTILFGERPSRMYLSWLPVTTSLYLVHPDGQAVSDFELLNQVGESLFEEVVDHFAGQSERGWASDDRMQLAALLYTDGDSVEAAD